MSRTQWAYYGFSMFALLLALAALLANHAKYPGWLVWSLRGGILAATLAAAFCKKHGKIEG